MRLPTDALSTLADKMENFEASPSRAKTGTGSRREGGQFEALAAAFWDALGDHLAASNGIREGRAPHQFRAFTSSARTLYIPTKRPSSVVASSPCALTTPRTTWFAHNFEATDLVRAFPGEEHAIEHYSPPVGPYAGTAYPTMYSGRRTKFDDTIVLEQDGVLADKILLEYKTAKSSRGTSVDGNAHERLSFQILQYLEVATRYPRCSFTVIANGAFAFYKNKYHVNFHIQAERLTAFSWFNMTHCCTKPEYAAFVHRLVRWLLADNDAREQ